MSRLQRTQPPTFPVTIESIPDARTIFLNNKIPVYFIEGGTEEIMRIEFIFMAGQVKEYMPLLASTTNMMLVEGTQNYSSEKLNEKLDYYGAFLNLSAEKDRAGIVIYFLNKHTEKILELCREILFRPVFPLNELNALMKKRLQWFQVHREKVQNLALDQFFESVFGNHHPYGKQILESDFNSIIPSVLMDFHSMYYSSENVAVIVSGKIHKRTAELLNIYFGNIGPESIYKEESAAYLKGDDRKKVFIPKKGAVQTAIRIGSSTINRRHPDYTGLKILNSILGGYFGSRLMKNIREEKGYTYGITSSISSFDLSGYKTIATEVGEKYTKKTIDEIYKEIRLLQTIHIEKKELDVVRNYMSGELVRMFDGPFALAESFRLVWEFGLDNTYYYKLNEKIKTIDSDEIMELAKTYYNIDELYEITVGAKWENGI
jgi:zinc protease